MAEEKITRIAREIYENVGGPENVRKVIHCMTRVRMTIIDETKVDLAGLKAIKGVLGVIEDETLQVVIGPGTVNKVAQAMVDMVGVKLGEPFPDTSDSLDELMAKTKANAKEKYNKPSKFKAVLNTIAKIFVPLIPAFVGAGLIGGLASVLSNLVTAGTLDLATWGQIITVLKIIQGGIFSYLAIYVGLNAVSLLLGMDPNAPLKNVFNGTPLSAGQGGIIGVIFAVWLLAIFEKRLHKFVPESLDIIITPTLSLLVIGLAEIFLIMPVAGVISSSLVGAINFILSVGGGISGFVLGALFLPMVMFGLHQILTPIHLEMISKTGSTQLLPVLAMAGAGQVGAAIALWVRLRKDKEFVERVKGALPVGILGIGEPLIYGITLPLGRPFVTACIGGGIGGAVIGALGNAGAIAIGPSGVALLPLIADGKWWIYLCGLLGGYIGGFVATYFFGIPADAKMKADNYATVGPKEVVEPTLKVVEPVKFKTTTIKAPLSGKVVKLSKLNDQVFASGLMGKGVAIEPTNGEVCAPVTGTITSILPTKHAIGITSDEGVELLIHVGMDTVELKGVGFECFVNENEHVKAGDLLLKADLKKIKAAGFSATTPIVVTNTKEYSAVEVISSTEVTKGYPLITIKA